MSVDSAARWGFSLTEGAPFRRLRVALGLDRRRVWGTPQGAVLLGLAAWAPLLVASLAEGLALGWDDAFVMDVGVHARFLLAVPLAIAAERPIARRLDHALRYLEDAGLIHDENRAACLAAVRRAERLRDHPAPEPLIAVAAFALSYVDLRLHSGGPPTWIFPRGLEGPHASIAGWIYFAWSVPLARFIILRWAWRLVIWSMLLVQLARARLRINAAHPDGKGGLFVLCDAHTSFGWLALAMGIAFAGNLWSERARAGLSVLAYRSELLVFSFGAPLLFLLPLFAFSWPIERARRRFRAEYASAAADFAARYARQWIHPQSRDPLPLGTGETSAHTDLVTSFDRVETTRFLPFTAAQYFTLAIAAATPMVAFVLQEVPLLDLLRRVKDAIG